MLDPDDFYILASREAVVVPADQAAEMLAYDTLVGEFRVHYAGFFDPGFGMAETGGQGSRAVLEVRSHEVPFLIEHGQIDRPARLRAADRAARQALWRRRSARPTSARAWRCRSTSRSRRMAVDAPFRSSAGRGGAAASRGDQRVGAVDLPGIEHRLDFGDRLDDDADVLVLVGEPVDPAGVAAESTRPQNRWTALVKAAAGRQDRLGSA